MLMTFFNEPNMLDFVIRIMLQELFKTITYHKLVSLTLESDCLNVVGLAAILTMSMWLAPRAGKPVHCVKVHCRVAEPDDVIS